MCDKHYRRFKAHGDPSIRLTLVGGTCVRVNCDRRSFGKGLCQNHYYEDWRDRGGRELKAAAVARRRALVAGARGVDASLSWPQLMKDDGTTCYICGVECKPSDYREVVSRAGRRQRICGETYPTLDHVIPLSRGGEHTRGNVRLACMGCNRRKSARVAHEAKQQTAGATP